MATVLQTARLLLRRFEPGDSEHLHAITGDPDVMRFVGDLKPFSPQRTRTMIADAMAHYEQRGFGEYAIICKATGELIGFEVLGTSFDPHNHASMRVAAKAGFEFARTGLDEHGLPTVYYEQRRPEGTP